MQPARQFKLSQRLHLAAFAQLASQLQLEIKLTGLGGRQRQEFIGGSDFPALVLQPFFCDFIHYRTASSCVCRYQLLHGVSGPISS